MGRGLPFGATGPGRRLAPIGGIAGWPAITCDRWPASNNAPKACVLERHASVSVVGGMGGSVGYMGSLTRLGCTVPTKLISVST